MKHAVPNLQRESGVMTPQLSSRCLRQNQSMPQGKKKKKELKKGNSIQRHPGHRQTFNYSLISAGRSQQYLDPFEPRCSFQASQPLQYARRTANGNGNNLAWLMLGGGFTQGCDDEMPFGNDVHL